MSTEESKVKEITKALLDKYKIYPAAQAGSGPGGRGFPADAKGWYWMPIKMSSYGVNGIPDFEGHFQGWYFGVETKKKSKKAEGFQALQISAIRCSGGACFVVDGPESLREFEDWLILKGTK